MTLTYNHLVYKQKLNRWSKWLWARVPFLSLSPVVTGLFTNRRTLNTSLVFIRQSYFAVARNITFNSKHYISIKTPNKREIQQIEFKP